MEDLFGTDSGASLASFARERISRAGSTIRRVRGVA
jgi:hypothetical protein